MDSETTLTPDAAAAPRRKPAARQPRTTKPSRSESGEVRAVDDPLAMDPVQRYAAIVAARALQSIRSPAMRRRCAGSYLGVLSQGWRWTASMVKEVRHACDTGEIDPTALLDHVVAPISRAGKKDELDLMLAGELPFPDCTMRQFRERTMLREQASASYDWSEDPIAAYLLGKPRLLDMLCESTLNFLDAGRDPCFQPAAELAGSVLRNADHLAATFGLEATERELVRLAIVAHRTPTLRCALSETTSSSISWLEILTGTLIDRPSHEVADALLEKGTLHSFHILDRVRGIDRVEELVRLGDIASQLGRSYKDSAEFLRRFLKPVELTGSLATEDFAHLGRSLVQIRQLLAASRGSGRRGINVLLYGAPGVGKTQLVHALARALDFDLFEVSGGDARESASRSARLAHLRMADTALAAQTRSLLMFDEASDVLQPPGLLDFFSRSKGNGESKLWMNQLLEKNQVPTVWVANGVDDVDPAHLRRFALVVEVLPPDRRARLRMTDDYLAPHGVTQATRQAIAAMSDLTPAELQGAARYLELTTLPEGSDAPADHPDHPDQRVIDQIGALRRAMGKPAPRLREPGVDYDPRFVNLEGAISLEAIVARLAQGKPLRVCASGPAGTGKSQLAKYLAEATGRELVSVGATALLSKYVGESEARVAEVFARAGADPERKILLIDEIDSFLSDRETQRDWMQGVTNEFLRQLDSFRGTLIVTTNLPLKLDGAAARRFDVQLEFKPLTAEQRVAMFPHSFGLELPAQLTDELIALSALVPADFAKVCSQRELLGQADDPAALIEQLALAMRVRTRTASSRAIGF